MTASNAMTTAKAFICQVHQAARTSQGLTPTIHGIDCSRFWLQGVIVSMAADGMRCAIDDGTGVVHVDLQTFLKSIPAGMGQSLRLGDLAMVIGPLLRRSAATSLSPLALSDHDSEPLAYTILAHQVMNVSQEPQQDAIWFLEVVEFWRNAMA